VRDAWVEIPDYENFTDFMLTFKEKLCCDLFDTLRKTEYLKQCGLAAGMDILTYHQK